MSIIKIAGVQMDIKIADDASNLQTMRECLQQTVAEGAELTVFPECTVSGYCFDSFEEARHVAQPIDGECVQAVVQMCSELNTMVVFGWLEQDRGRVFNSLALVGPTGVLGSYRKVHLPYLGVDRFTTPGDRPFEVVSTPQVRIGMNICYDSSFPEAARVLTMQGADLIALPTNWPPTSGLTADLIPNARALENHVYFMSVNRVGVERGIEFIGKSKICDPSGKHLAFADHNREAILYAQIDPELARQKHRVNIPGVHEVHRINDRRPDVYGPLTEPQNMDPE